MKISISFLLLLLLSSVSLFAQTEVDKRVREAMPPAPIYQSKSPEYDGVIFGRIQEEMPRFPGCEDQGLDRAELKKCAEEKLLAFMDANLEYPCFAQEHGVKGMVVVSFVIEKDGAITGAKILRDIGAGCGEAAIKMVKAMPDWIPGKQRGKQVRVQYNLPVRFRQG